MNNKMKIVAVSETDLIRFEYGGVIWKIAPLPFGVKKRLAAASTEATQGRNGQVGDLVDVALDAIRYGLKGWEGLTFSNGEEPVCKLVKDKNGEECLDQKSLELIYRTSAFDSIAAYCMQPHQIPQHMKDAVELGDQEAMELEPLDGDKKK